MLNLNVGLLGHVDSGKTSLAKALSETASTAAFDKSPQSKSRGITLDLGFSACEITHQTSPGCAELLTAAGLDRVACTLVDCPGHASLIRTVVGGSHIMDVMVLLVDATKGIQPQTAECLALGEVLTKPLVVVLNKIDAVQGNTAEERAASLERTKKRLRATFAKTRWPEVPMVDVAADPRGEDTAPRNTGAVLSAVLSVANLASLKLRREVANTPEGIATEKRKFMMLVDHCFAIRGHGTVFTGTVLGGLVNVGDSILIPELQDTRKVKSLQVFKKSVAQAKAGDRVGLCVGQFDPDSMERGVLCAVPEAATSSSSSSPSCATLERTDTLVARVHRVRFHTSPCDNHTKFHVTIGHTTVMATMRYFSRPADTSSSASTAPFDLERESLYEEELGLAEASLRFDTTAAAAVGQPLPEAAAPKHFFAILLLGQPVYTAVGGTLVAMRLDIEKDNICRLAMSGTVVALLPPSSASPTSPAWRALPIVRFKYRALGIDRVIDARTCIAEGVVLSNRDNTTDTHAAHSVAKKDKDIMHAEAQRFVGLKVEFRPSTEDGTAMAGDAIVGVIDSTFGKTGKVKLCFKQDVFAVGSPSGKKKSSGDGQASASSESPLLRPGELVLPLKKFPLALHSSIHQ